MFINDVLPVFILYKKQVRADCLQKAHRLKEEEEEEELFQIRWLRC